MQIYVKTVLIDIAYHKPTFFTIIISLKLMSIAEKKGDTVTEISWIANQVVKLSKNYLFPSMFWGSDTDFIHSVHIFYICQTSDFPQSKNFSRNNY